MKSISLIIGCFLPLAALSQKLTYFDDIQPIIYRHCISCHQPGQIAPFSLLTYEDVEKRATFIKEVVETRYMPPWFADPTFSHFSNERILPETDIQKIIDWVLQGKKKGKASHGLDPATFLRDSLRVAQHDMEFEMTSEFVIPGDNTEQFRIFVIPTFLPDDIYVKGVEFVPGNRRLAHHSRIMVDTTNKLRADNGIAVGGASEFEQQNVRMYSNFWQGWVPGNQPVMYPDGIAKKLPANADLVINMHYSPSPVPAPDRSKVRLYLAKEKPDRQVKMFILDENWISNPPFEIQAETERKFYMRSPLIPTDIALISVLPHMHKLGKNFKAWAITPTGDFIPLIHIPHWNFNWQTSYRFQGMVRLPKGSVVFAEAVFDNRSSNPANPSFPPRNVGYGWGTADEMLNLIFEYVEWKDGDDKR